MPTLKQSILLAFTCSSCLAMSVKDFATLKDTDQRIAALKRMPKAEGMEAINNLSEPQRIALLQAMDAEKRKKIRVKREKLQKAGEELEGRRKQLSNSKNADDALKELDEQIEQNKENLNNLNTHEKELTALENRELGIAVK